MDYRTLFELAVILPCLVVPLRPQAGEANDFHRAATLPGASWRDRESAFYQLLRSGPRVGGGSHPWAGLPVVLAAQPDAGESVRLDLIRALARDAAWGRSQKALPEEFCNYEGDLIAAVASLDDPRSMDALFEVVDLGNMAVDALARFGDRSLLRAISLMDSPRADWGVRSSAVFLLSKIARPGNLARLRDPSSKRLLLSALLRSLHDSDTAARLFAIDGLVEIGDKSAIPALSQLAARDSTEAPVRQRAAEAVAKLSGR